MIKKFIHNNAVDMGIELTSVTVVDGNTVGCNDIYLLHLAAKDRLVSMLVYQSEYDDVQNGLPSHNLEKEIRTALSRLELLDPQLSNTPE